jgi:hypothetical protein
MTFGYITGRHLAGIGAIGAIGANMRSDAGAGATRTVLRTGT